jgi:hypothetical protein
MQSRSRWIDESFLGCPPGRRSLAVGEVDLELAPDGVADPALQRPERFFLGLPLRDLALVVDAAGCVVTDLGDRDEMHRMVQLAVAARVEPVPCAGSTRCLNRRGAVVGRESCRCCEACGVADVGEDQRGDDRADTVDFAQCRA